MNRQSGSSLIEMLFALSILTVGLLGFFAAFTVNFTTADEVSDHDEARVAMERVAEELRSADFDTLYQDYNGATFEVPYLSVDTSTSTTTAYTTTGYGSSTPASIQSTLYVNEHALPAEFGPILDIDGSGGLQTADCSATYKLLPVRLTITFTVGTRTETRDQYLVLSKS